MTLRHYQLKKLEIRLKQFGIQIVRHKDCLTLNANQIKTPLPREINQWFYRILNMYENYYFVLINGLPYCLLPEADDHIIYKKIKHVHYQKNSCCKECKYFSLCPGLRQNEKYHFRFLPLSDLPQDIAIEVNKSCNLKCEFCPKGNKHESTFLSYAKIKKILDEASALKIKYIRFTGGEPLLRTDILRILKYAKSKDFYVFLNTNATLLNESLIKELEKYVDNILISLCGYSNYTEKMINAGGAFLKNKLNSILKLVKSRIPYFRVGTVISKLLINNFKEYSALITALGIKNWELYRPMLPISTFQRLPVYNINKNDLLTLLSRIYTLKKTGINVYIANATPFCITNINKYRPMMRGAQFDDGHHRLVLDSSGFFKPSYFINKNLGDNIEKAWNHPFIKEINSSTYLPYRCQHCQYLKWCLGGSRYLAKEYRGDYFACDPLMDN